MKKKQTKVKFGISQRMLVTLLCVAVGPLAAVWALSYQANIALTTQKAQQQLSAINSKLAVHVDDWVDMNKRMLRQNARLSAIRSMQADRQNPVLKGISKFYDWSYLAFTIDPSGENIGRSDGRAPKFYGDRDYFRQVMRGAPFGEQILIGKTSGKPALILATAIYDNTGKINGVLAIAMNLSKLSNEITGSRIGTTGFTFLLDQNGEVIAHPNEKYARERMNLSQHPALLALQNRNETFTTYQDHGRKVVAVSKRTAEGWTMISQQNYAEAFASIQRENLKAIGLLAITLLAVIALAAVMARRLTAPIRDLTEVADQFSMGKLDLPISGLERSDEIGHLAQAIERLGTSIRLAMERLQKKT